MPSQLQFNPLRAFGSNGNPSPGALAYFYESGTSTPLTVYTDDSLATAHPTPLVADAQGVFPPVFVDGATAVKVNVTTSAGAALNGYPLDPVQLVSISGSAASQVSFAPISGNPATNVQDAIQFLTDRWNNVSNYGKDLIAAIDAAAARSVLGLGGLATQSILDEDNMATDSATRPPSQQSTKAYVDARVQSAVFLDSKASGTAGGTFTSAAWQTRTLNQTNYNDITGCTLSANRITLPAGTYRISARAPAYNVAAHQARVFNVTDSVALIGGSAYSSTGATSDSHVEATATFAASTVIELQHYCASTKTTDGFGYAASTGGDEKYSAVRIDRIG